MKLAIQRLVRGDDGLTKVVYIDLGTLQQIGDLTGYRIVNSGDLYEEPVVSVDDPETPSNNPENPAIKNTGSRGENDGRNNPSPVQAPNQSVAGPSAPAAPAAVTQPGAIRTPTSRTPAATAPTTSASPVTTPSQTSMGPLGGIKTAQGSILPDLEQTRFDKNIAEWSQTQRDLKKDDFNETENLRRENARNLPPGTPQTNVANLPSATQGEMTAAPRSSGVANLPSANQGEMRAASRVGAPDLPSAPRGEMGVNPSGIGRPDVSGVGIARNAYDTSYGVNRGAINAGIMATDDMPTRPSDTISAKQASLPSVSRNAYDVQKAAERVTSGIGTTVAGRPERVGSLPAAQGIKTSPTLGTKDDWAGPVGTSMAGDAVFDRPSPTSGATRSVAGKVVDAAKAPTSAVERSTTGSGFVSAANNPSKSKTTSFTDEAGYSQTDRTGNRGWRNNNPGNIEASAWTKSQEGYIGDDGRFAAFDTYENGVKAQAALLGTPAYANKTIAGAIARYAPAFENNTAAYAAAVAKAIGVDVNTKMSDLTPSQRVGMVNAMHEVEGSTITGRQSTSLTEKGINARDNYTGFGTGSDTPSERNAANRPASGTSFGAGGSRGVASNIGRNDSAGAGRGSSPGGPSLGGGIGRASSGGSGGSSYGGGSSGPGGTAGKSASGGVSGASRSTAGKTGSSPSAGSGGISGASRSTAGKTSSTGAGGSAGASQRSGGLF
jgi:hypothetical protein